MDFMERAKQDGFNKASQWIALKDYPSFFSRGLVLVDMTPKCVSQTLAQQIRRVTDCAEMVERAFR
jgi:hypothetical protein